VKTQVEQRTIYLVVQRSEDEGTDWTNVEMAFTTRADAEEYIKDWEDEHDDLFGETHSFFQDDNGRKIPARCKKQREENRPDWCPGCGEDRALEEHTLIGPIRKKGA
jgi:hypothetical protein